MVPRSTAPAAGLSVTVDAVPNTDFRPSSHEATVLIPAKQVPVGNLAEAVKVVGAFIATYDLGGGNWPSKAGLVLLGGKPIARISYNLRIPPSLPHGFTCGGSCT